MVVARALASLYEPVKMNYEIHGNVVPHLHLHLYPRYDGDPYGTGVLRAREDSFTRTEQELSGIGDAVRPGAPARTRGRSVSHALRAPGSTA
jgi:diadenosine tetraphosphate (Ap4A) HIT family hydrolase